MSILDSKIPSGPLADKWTKHKNEIDLVNPAYSDKVNEKIDIAIMQKLLPKLHGSRRKLLKTLNLLAQKCLTESQEVIFNERGIYNIAESNSIILVIS